MTDPRVMTFIWVILAVNLVAGISRASAHFMATRQKHNQTERYTGYAIYGLLGVIAFFLAIWVDQTLWNLIAPVFDWPMIDLLTAGAIGVLVLSLVWSTSMVRTVRVLNDRKAP